MPRRRDLAQLVRLAAAHGRLAAGAPLRQVQASTGLPAGVIANAATERAPGKALAWSEAEDDYLRRHLGWLSEDELARHLGRTVTAVHLRWKRDLHLAPPTRQPSWLTACQIANLLQVDPKAVVRWVDQGLLPSRRLPTRRVIRAVPELAFRVWVLNPMHWIYFHPERVRDPHLKRLLKLKARRWHDAWLTVGQAARLRGVCSTAINNALRAGKLQGVKWGNWHVLRSEVLKPGLRFFVGKGGRAVPKVAWSEEADAFLVLATALGYAPGVIARMMGGKRSRLAWTPKRVAYRLSVLKRASRITSLIRTFNLQVQFRRGHLSADWKTHRRRFKRRPVQ
jgi:hypothetical protein